MTDTEMILQKMDLLMQKIDGYDSKFESLESKMNDGFETLNERINQVDNKVVKTQLTLENEISRKIDIIGEGHDFLKQRLDDALKMEVNRERMELEMINLKMEIDKIKAHLDIA